MSLDVVLSGIFSGLFLASVLRISTPLILPALGGLISDLAGSINIALEGIMLVAAFVGVVVSAYTQSWVLGVLSGILSGMLVAGMSGIFSPCTCKPILSWLASPLISWQRVARSSCCTSSPGIKAILPPWPHLAVPNIHIPLIKDIPFIGTVVSGHNIFVYLAFILTAAVAVLLYRTRLGVHIRAVGENPAAADSVGINVRRTQLTALLLSGFFASLGGLVMSMAYLTLFQREMTAGRGLLPWQPCIWAVASRGARCWQPLSLD
jgi:general nucleoside transport system permease protein